jgi:FkbM family methyltransferase
MNLLFKIQYQLLKLTRMTWFSIRYSLNSWKKIEGVYIPVSMSYGYPVLRFIDNGEYEQNEIAIIKNTLGPGDVVLELGAGMGFVSSYCARAIGSYRVHTYEANISLKPIIESCYTKNDVHPEVTFAMLGVQAGTRTFYKDAGSFLASSTERSGTTGSIVSEVPVLDLNEVIARIDPTYLMMDIEGGEYDIFKGIDFRGIQKIQFELHPAVLSSEKIAGIFSRLAGSGFLENKEHRYGNNFYFKKQAAANS